MKVEAFLLLTLAAVPAAARTPPRPPDAQVLLVRTLTAPATGYVARGRIQSFSPGRKPKGLSTTTYALPDGRLRREARKSPRRPAELILVDDGNMRSLYAPKLGAAWSGPATRETVEEASARIRSFFEVSVATGGHVAKRPTWRLNLSAPDGRLRRSLWVDQGTGLVLKRETYRLDGTLSRRERFLSIDWSPPDAGFFRLEIPQGTPVASLTAPRDGAGADVDFPRWTPEGYLPLDVRAAGTGEWTIGYGDGASKFEIVEGPRDAGLGVDEKGGRAVRLKGGGRAVLVFAGGGQILVRRTSSRAYAISGDLAEDEMARVAESLPEPAR